jgi:hypothetical protein
MIVLKEVLSCEGHRAFFSIDISKEKSALLPIRRKIKGKKRLKFPAVP